MMIDLSDTEVVELLNSVGTIQVVNGPTLFDFDNDKRRILGYGNTQAERNRYIINELDKVIWSKCLYYSWEKAQKAKNGAT